MGAIKVWDGTSWQVAAGAGAAVWVGPEAPAGTAKAGDQWFDTDDPSMLPLPVVVASGGTGATTAAAARTSLAVPGIPVPLNQGGTAATDALTARTNLAVSAAGNSTSTAGAPTTGTWVRGDMWLDSANVLWTCIVAGAPGTWRNTSGPRTLIASTTSSATVATSAKYQFVLNVTLPIAGEVYVQGIVYCYRLSGPGGAEVYQYVSQVAGYAAPAYISTSVVILPTLANGYMATPLLGRFGVQPAGAFSFGMNLDSYVPGTVVQCLGAAATVTVQPT